MRHLYVATCWAGLSGWSYAVMDCELIEGGHRDHRQLASAGGFTSERAARTAGDLKLAEIREAERSAA